MLPDMDSAVHEDPRVIARCVDGRIVLDHGGFAEICPSIEDLENDPTYRAVEAGWIFIYGLADPSNGAVRYIGKSTRPLGRLADHCNEKPACHRTRWIHSLAKDGLRPVLGILDRLRPDSDWQRAERAWIAYARQNGWPLVNGTDGGDGVVGLNEESRRRIAESWKGRKHRPESLEKIGRASRGRKHTEEYKQMMREKMSIREFTAEHRRRLSVAGCLASDIVAEIRRRLSAGEKVKDIAAAVGVHRTTVSRYKISPNK